MSGGCEKEKDMNLDSRKEYSMRDYKDQLALKQEFEKRDYFVTTGQIHTVKVAEFIVVCERIKKKEQ
ncbi:MAG: hypothetical protein ABRQ37_04670 [Candidatus Eremiobacterota bacterium]